VSRQRQTLREEGTQSHGTHAVSRATEQTRTSMDPRPTTDSVPAARVQSWLRIAARLDAGTQVPAQRIAA